MGASFTNYQVRAKTASKVKKALEPLVKSRAYVSPEKNGWVTIYDESSDDQNEAVIIHIATELSKSLVTTVLACLVHDSDIAAYWLYQSGALTDEFNSAPDYFGEEVDDKTRTRLRGNTDALLPLCVASTTREDIEAVIHPPDDFPMMVEDVFVDLAKLLGIDDARIGLGFTCFDNEGEEILADASEFEPVGKGASRKKAQAPNSSPQVHVPAFDMFSLAIGMLTKCWDSEQERMAETFSQMLATTGQKSDGLLKKMNSQFDRGAKDMLKQSALAGRPTFEELKAARDSGPEALAELLVKRTPTQLGSIADGAIQSKLEKFISALLTHGMNPNTKNQHGQSLYDVAQQRGNPTICQMLKSAPDNNG